MSDDTAPLIRALATENAELRAALAEAQELLVETRMTTACAPPASTSHCRAKASGSGQERGSKNGPDGVDSAATGTAVPG